MNIYRTKSIGKWIGLSMVFIIVILILFFTNKFVNTFEREEHSKMELWTQAMKQITIMTNLDQDVSFPMVVLEKNNTIPIINTYENGKIKWTRNLSDQLSQDSLRLYALLKEMKQEHAPIVIEYPDQSREFVYYKNSTILSQLSYYPIVMLILLTVFGLLTFWAFRSTKNSEQSLLWAAMAKETAHQIGTPLSSLMGWTELLKLENIDQSSISEIERDVDRLKIIAERFSKIGSIPELQMGNIADLTRSSFNYLESRSSKHSNFTFSCVMDCGTEIPFNPQLLSWVLENLIKNSIDAMQGKGDITVRLLDKNNYVQIQVEDSGKGIPKSNFKTIFEPGYTTKKRGWGLGLSLAKRIIEEFHHGRIFVLKSEVNQGTTFAINLQKNLKRVKKGSVPKPGEV